MYSFQIARVAEAAGHAAGTFMSRSYATCTRQEFSHRHALHWSRTSHTLHSLLHCVDEALFCAPANRTMSDLLERFVVFVPRVLAAAARSSATLAVDPFNVDAGGARICVARPAPALYARERGLRECLAVAVGRAAPSAALRALGDRVLRAQCAQFPEKRLIEYDCGKLQLMARLLRSLAAGGHRVLVFTLMTRMLDILENFLNYHGYR